MKKYSIYALLLVNLCIIALFWWQGAIFSGGIPNILISFGRLFGLLAAFFVLLQFLLIGRSIWLEQTFGLDRLSRVHHLNGNYSILFILLHPTFLIFGYAMAAHVIPPQQFITFLTTYPDVLNAFIAVLLLVGVVIFSIYIVRKRLKYETWYFIHFATYAAVLLAWGHQLKNGTDFQTSQLFVFYWYALYIFILGSHVIFRFLKPSYVFVNHQFYVKKVERETDKTTSVYISGKRMEKFRIQPGQFMILRFLGKKTWWQAHPFSLSFVPRNNLLRVTVKNVGDFTSHIPHLALNTPVIIDGPYGTFTEKQSTKKKVLLIAGGIGITPLRSLLEQLARERKDVILLYSNRTVNEIVFKKEIDELHKEYAFPVHYFLSQEKRAGFIAGRINKREIKRLIPDVVKRDIYVCGPQRMLHAIRTDLSELGVPASQVHYEQFSLQ